MKRVLSALIFCICLSCTKKTTPDTFPAVGVPLDLAQYRASVIDGLTYDLQFSIPTDTAQNVMAEALIDFQLQSTEQDIFLDFKVAQEQLETLVVNGEAVEGTIKNEHIRLPRQLLVIGDNHIRMAFRAGEQSLNRNASYLYTLLVPDRARTLFPCFDQPNLKATYKLRLSLPEHWKALSAGGIAETLVTENGKTVVFEPTEKISTYLFSFVAGDFKTQKTSDDPMPMRFLYRETDSNKVRLNQDQLFSLHRNALDFLEEYTGTDFPFQKMDFACIPGFQYGGMEHVGAIQYRENALILDDNATTNQRLGRAKLISHETAHMWFGDLVTMEWFNDVWMKEVFANFMADKIVNPAFPDINHDLAFMSSHYPRAYGEDRTAGTNPIRQDLGNLNNAGSLYGNIIYHKAPIMMRQLELLMGEDAFASGLSDYISTFAHGNASWPDLIALLDKRTEVDLEAWSSVWVNSPGRPIFRQEIAYDQDNRITEFALYQSAEEGGSQIWPQEFEIALQYPDSLVHLSVKSLSSRTVLPEAIGLPRPIGIRFNSNGMGYGLFPIDIALPGSEAIAADVDRGAHFINLYENTLYLNPPPDQTLSYFIETLAEERNTLLLGLLSGYSQSLFWKYLPIKKRKALQSELTESLWRTLNANHPPDKKKLIFQTFKSLAYEGKALDRLYAIHQNPNTIENLSLSLRERTELAMDLALYGHPYRLEILADAREAQTNPDALARFDFILPSVTKDSVERQAYVQGFRNAKNREKEAWTTTALSYLNHPLHEEMALEDLSMYLELLPEIQETGDIFFPKRWLGASVGRHTSKEAYAMVRQYIKEHRDLEPSLLGKLLQSTDHLKRRYGRKMP